MYMYIYLARYYLIQLVSLSNKYPTSIQQVSNYYNCYNYYNYPTSYNYRAIYISKYLCAYFIQPANLPSTCQSSQTC